ncbi:MAG: CDP-alcohol phosphatidyltransferase family protein [Hydrogenophaga sp.]|nr:CDP-alcohol phosphatidyltransferase family protein [Hydrogenophaga sp.]
MSQPITPNHAATLAGAERSALRADAARSLGAALTLSAMAAVALGAAGGLGTDFSLKTLMLFGVLTWLVWHSLFGPGQARHPHGRFGSANRVTLLRLGVCALLAALLGEQLPSQAWWAVVVLATAAALLDAVDGPLARRSGLASDFGARFDMETDAFFTLVLCALVWQAGQAGAWVLASGLMRYAFVALAKVWPWLDGALPPSRRRQTVCVVQITTLIVCLGPVVPPLLASALAAFGLVLLTLSFAIDIRFLHRAQSKEI